MLWVELKRKLFHLSGFIYVAGLYLLERPFFLWIMAFMVGFIFLVETIRLKNSRAQVWFENYFGGLFREQEKNHLSGVFWMSAGVLCAALILPSPALAATAVCYLLLGDGVASLAGKGLGGPRWVKSEKRISGSAACLIICVGVGALLLRPEHSWMLVWVGAAAATMSEFGIIPLNDNLMIPLVSSLVLKFFSV